MPDEMTKHNLVFSGSYIRLCMTKEIKSEFRPPHKKGSFCIYKEEKSAIYRVHCNLGLETEFDIGESSGLAKTSDLTWIPTLEEIRLQFNIEEDNGFMHGYTNFRKDPDHYGYSWEELSQFPSKEERFLLYCMVVKRARKFKENKWVPYNYQ
jgi:hypothetical protein